MKKNVTFAAILAAGLFAAPCVIGAQMSHGSHKMMMGGDESSKMMMSMHHAMMMQPFATGIHPDISYLVNMIPHHQGAVDSSKMMLGMSKDKKIQAIAQNIITSQEKEIAEFTALVETLKKEKKAAPKAADLKKFDTEAKASMDKMMEEMSAVAPSGDINKDFLSGMISHHMGAVVSSKQILKQTTDPRIKKIAETIIAAQEKEIKEFKQLISK